MRPNEDRRFASFGAKPGIVAMGLEHEDAGEAAHPVDVGETFHGVSKYRTEVIAERYDTIPACLRRAKSDRCPWWVFGEYCASRWFCSPRCRGMATRAAYEHL